MPLLVLARHATTPKAHHTGTSDFERPLGEEGLAQSRRMGRFLREYGRRAGAGLDTVIASAALRTVQTAQQAADELDLPLDEVREDRALYQSGVTAWLEAVATIPPASSGALIVGHEPTLTDVVAHLTGTWELPHLRPSTVVVFALESWDETPWERGEPYGDPDLIRDFKTG